MSRLLLAAFAVASLSGPALAGPWGYDVPTLTWPGATAEAPKTPAPATQGCIAPLTPVQAPLIVCN